MKAFLATMSVIITAGLIGITVGNHLVITIGSAPASLRRQPSSSVIISTGTAPSTGNIPSTNQPQSGSTGNITTASSAVYATANWAGYFSSGGSYSGVTATWVVPKPVSTDSSSSDATWIGIGGVVSNDLIQVGTQNDVSANGNVYTSAFYETLPQYSKSMPSISVSPGDSVTASVVEIGTNLWKISLQNNTIGTTSSVVVSYDSSMSSAEWIEEEPSNGAQQEIPLDNFGNVSFTNGRTTVNGNNVSIAGSRAQPMTLVNSSYQILASTSALSSNGSSFSVTRSNAASSASTNGYYQYPLRIFRHGYGGKYLTAGYL